MIDTGDDAIRQALQALFELANSIRDNVLLPEWAVDELLDAQPDGAHAKRLLLSLEINGLIPPDQCAVAMVTHELGGE